MQCCFVLDVVFPRSFYPKTTVPMATKFHPIRFRTIGGTFKWAPMFLNRIAKCHSIDWIKKRLSKWNWMLSTSFSGVGCAESVYTPAPYFSTSTKSKTQSLQPTWFPRPPSPSKQLHSDLRLAVGWWSLQLVRSTQRARRFYRKHMVTSNASFQTSQRLTWANSADFARGTTECVNSSLVTTRQVLGPALDDKTHSVLFCCSVDA